ncbi:MAG TPA: phosphomannomutase/phosphoglucomutase [Candidatus Hydrothermia bacterium]|nr:phosphomannomutase/phosphoglucomutase [Candidatus Hydrothermae bacterium]MDD3648594.1 phosphomannomutase/phosphoglucomutase [Candidatus Hydrothermia bacterium]MDD5573320.1 phosphomannomutase/phosphoglucomutase [Candidatus Hydrothermia bacterium]HOK22546.1 phosphomannomutase/phosphoglucomutase [Candidatus Hydrothermia bacterium]HOL23253.1 phosphomannomutase/phosphoglucomutase [Candidatus Hydrothermia bacterium]
MKVAEEIFRMYDIRGIYGKELDENIAFAIGRGFGTIIREKGGNIVSVGMDARPSSTPLKEALIYGFIKSGVSVYDIGLVPTPLQYYSLFKYEVHGGVQVTASHNPREYNGFKLSLGKDTFFGDGIQALMQLIKNENYINTLERGHAKKLDVVDRYIYEMIHSVNIKGKNRVAIDPGNGTAGPVVSEIFKALKIPFEGIYMEVDGTFPNHLADPTIETYMEDLEKKVVKEKFDLGIGYDGDADRIGAITNKGVLLFGDKLLGIFARQVLKNIKGATIIYDVKCSKGLTEYISSLGGKPVMWKTGHALLKAKLRELNAPLAGEMSGHIFFNDRFYGYDDGIYASLRLLEILEEEEKSLENLAAEIPFYYSSPEIRIGCPDNKKFEVVNALVEKFKKDYEVIDIDGVRIEFPDGFGLIRASNTQPVLVVRFEGKTKKKLEEIRELVFNALAQFKEVDFKEENH